MLSVLSKYVLLLAIIATAQRTGCPSTKHIYKDVAIIGGGASGAYAAVRLRDDFNKSISLVEIQDRLVSQAFLFPQPCCSFAA